MTWVIGATTPFGYGVMVSDICVTLSDGTVRDVLRKAYPVGRFIVAGFAGSVRIGFEMISALREFLAMTKEEVDEGHCWDPEFVAVEFQAKARKIFDRHNDQEKDLGCEILLVGVCPKEKTLGGGNSVVAALRGPTFSPDIAKRWGKVLSIGSGSNQQKAMESLAATVSQIELLQTEVMNPGGFGNTVAFSVTRKLFWGAPAGISRHLHVSLVGINRLTSRANDLEYRSKDGQTIKLRMPRVAENYEELCLALGLLRGSAKGLVAKG